MALHRVSLLVAVTAVAAASLFHLLQLESAAPLAQQRAQTDLEFTRERARVTAAERRVAALRQRLAGLERAAAGQDSANAAGGEHVILGRDGPPPAGNAAPARMGSAPAAAQPAERRSERRIPQTLTHRDRFVTAAETQDLSGRLDAAAQQARSLGERVNRPDFGAGLRALEQELERLEAEIASYE